jgi:hypothetical protein
MIHGAKTFKYQHGSYGIHQNSVEILSPCMIGMMLILYVLLFVVLPKFIMGSKRNMNIETLETHSHSIYLLKFEIR